MDPLSNSILHWVFLMQPFFKEFIHTNVYICRNEVLVDSLS
jgi:hypothetical protein